MLVVHLRCVSYKLYVDIVNYIYELNDYLFDTVKCTSANFVQENDFMNWYSLYKYYTISTNHIYICVCVFQRRTDVELIPWLYVVNTCICRIFKKRTIKSLTGVHGFSYHKFTTVIQIKLLDMFMRLSNKPHYNHIQKNKYIETIICNAAYYTGYENATWHRSSNKNTLQQISQLDNLSFSMYLNLHSKNHCVHTDDYICQGPPSMNGCM